MPISPLGNIHFVNQNVGVTSTQVGNELAKEGFANLANLQEFEAKEKIVDKLEKVAQTNEIQEEIKEKEDDEETKKRKQNKQQSKENASDKDLSTEEEQEESAFKNSHKINHLDLSI